MTNEELTTILEKHDKWQKNEEGGERADLYGADLYGANLHDADLGGADLHNADLRVKHPPINDHYFISEILFREAKTVKERSYAGLVRISLDWCWEDFLENAPKAAIVWAKKILCSKWPEFEEMFKEV